jgi:hypothetical protein
MRTTNKAQIGEVIQSEAFAFGYHPFLGSSADGLRANKKYVIVDGKTKSRPIGTGEDSERVEFGAYDKSRGTATFVVESAEKKGGQDGDQFNHYENRPDGWNVRARRLGPDHSYDSEGEEIEFYQSGDFLNAVPWVNVLGTLGNIDEAGLPKPQEEAPKPRWRRVLEGLKSLLD